MTAIEKQKTQEEKILRGLEVVYERLIAYKKEKNSVLVVIKDNKIEKIKP